MTFFGSSVLRDGGRDVLLNDFFKRWWTSRFPSLRASSCRLQFNSILGWEDSSGASYCRSSVGRNVGEHSDGALFGLREPEDSVCPWAWSLPEVWERRVEGILIQGAIAAVQLCFEEQSRVRDGMIAQESFCDQGICDEALIGCADWPSSCNTIRTGTFPSDGCVFHSDSSIIPDVL